MKRHSKSNMRCTATGCRKRFKGHSDDPCPACGHWATIDQYAYSRKKADKLCRCDAYHWSMSNGPHRLGSGKCKYANRPDDETPDA